MRCSKIYKSNMVSPVNHLILHVFLFTLFCLLDGLQAPAATIEDVRRKPWKGVTFIGKCSCGPNFIPRLNGNPPLPRVASGQDAKIEDFPYVVRLYHKFILCTGAIISAPWVLTAAHCIFEAFPYEVQAGFDDTNSTGMQKRIPIKTIVHEFYDNVFIAGYDVALIEVRQNILMYLFMSHRVGLASATIKVECGLGLWVLPFDLSEKVSPVPLSNEMWPQGKQMYNVPCVAAGWGLHEIGGKSSNKLQKLDVTAGHGEDGCACTLPYVNKRMLCIKGKTGKGVCSGDSGGVLVCNKKAVGIAHVIYLEETCNPFRIRMPKLSCKQAVSAYIYICPILDWIRKRVPEIPGTPTSCTGSKISPISDLVMVFSILINFFL